MMQQDLQRPATGWLPDLIDTRDFDAAKMPKEPLILTSGQPPPTADSLPTKVDNRVHCSPVENQGRLGSCTAQAVAGMVEYNERVLANRHIDVSRLFLYKTGRQLDGYVGDVGSHVRSVMRALKIFGAPPERYWTYDVARFDEDPPAFVFAYGQSLQAISYWRYDMRERPWTEVLTLVKETLANARALVFGFRVYNYGNRYGEFTMPEPGARPLGGHAIMAVGFDDARRIDKSIGALLIRNSWGTGWGDGGYGWLPYDYVIGGLTADWWTLLRKETLF